MATSAEHTQRAVRRRAPRRPVVEELRAAINHHRSEGRCDKVVSVVLPEKSPSRQHWLTRSQAAQLLRAAWRFREFQKGKPTDRRSRRHVARFILVALYTGTRAGAVCGAALGANGRQGLDRPRTGHLLSKASRRAGDEKATTSQFRSPNRLLAHLRRWKRQGQRYAVEWNAAGPSKTWIGPSVR